jgi:hypothetical protein
LENPQLWKSIPYEILQQLNNVPQIQCKLELNPYPTTFVPEIELELKQALKKAIYRYRKSLFLIHPQEKDCHWIESESIHSLIAAYLWECEQCYYQRKPTIHLHTE